MGKRMIKPPVSLGLMGFLAALLALTGCSQGRAPSASGPPRGGEAGRPEAGRTEPGGGGRPAADPRNPAGGGRRFAAIPVQAVTVQTGPLTADNSTAGSVVPAMQSQVAAQVAGVVSRVVRLSGEWVRKGDTVVQLDDAQLALTVRNAQAALEDAKINYAVGQDATSQSNPKLELQVQAAQSTLAAAQKNYDAQRALYELGGTSASQLDNAKSQLQQAQANLQAARAELEQNRKAGSQSLAQLRLAVDQAANQLQIARLNLQNAAVKAPFDGQIAAVNVSPGMYVSQNTPVFLLVSADRQVNFSVPPTDAIHLPAGTTVHFAYAGQSLPIRVSQAPSAPINGVVPMVAAVPRSFAPPYGAVGTVSYGLTLAQGALVPITAVETAENRNFVYTVVDGKAMTQPITILAETGVTAAVAGLREGTQVIVNAPPGLLPGSAVRVVGGRAGGIAWGSSGGTGADGSQGGGQKGGGPQAPPADRESRP